jgi:hypothetical protein
MTGLLVLEYRTDDGVHVVTASAKNFPFDPAEHSGDAVAVRDLFEAAGQDLAFALLRKLQP